MESYYLDPFKLWFLAFQFFHLKKAKKYGYQAKKAPFYVQCLCFVLSLTQLTMKNVSQHINVVMLKLETTVKIYLNSSAIYLSASTYDPQRNL